MELTHRIKEDILNNRLPMGVALRQTVLSARYGVSRIPVRDALQALKAEAWLVPHGKAGVMIPELDWKEAEDLALMRTRLESLALGFAFEYIVPAHLDEANSYLRKLEATDLTLLERGELNWCFHYAIYQACHRPTLMRAIEVLNIQASRYLGFQFGPLGYHNHSQEEHRAWLELIRCHKKTEAVLLLEKHIMDAGQRLTEYLKKA
ncbi:GntR family transcriptional regulator [Marinomonas posidonica]|uniref:Transcriptional regulator, GntR family n=1 Tax=Marinomonas posidonica (strain CECT 7376 / NCIMB 14433 / IVIA-Po-181) TaxID=491952 RepID=F6CZF8_MARPP|nr:GntR family transcriptional regulator [Marinomonas posidonica]AEF54695.1 transcriptional regulator, GntR family [Marinomonas posidonica IVIA-Po-181]